MGISTRCLSAFNHRSLVEVGGVLRSVGGEDNTNDGRDFLISSTSDCITSIIVSSLGLNTNYSKNICV